ncbi:MAG: pirin family protein [Steroidobacteraceae bacterium]|jgi:redox-sensitive bicupin YhaK (pirin superfamily)
MNARPQTPSTLRSVVRVVRGSPTSDGAGVRLMRLIGTEGLSELDPFLLLDQFGSDSAADYIAGFPEHPHRGFETVTYMLEGRMRHRDNQGNEGLLVSGSVQWMTAGRGIVHSEMPEQEAGRMSGFQLWVNLPAARKMTAPRYQDIPPERIPLSVPGPGVNVRVVAGRVGEVTGPVEGIATAPLFLDVALEASKSFELQLPTGHTAFVCAFEGSVSIGSTLLNAGELGVLGAGSALKLESASGGRAIVVAARPLGEPVARYGPFVMNTRAEIIQAIEDFNAGRF